MKSKVAESTQKKNLNNLHRAYRGNGDSILGKGILMVLQKSDYLESIQNVKLELGFHPTPKNAYIDFELEEKDVPTLESYGLQSRFYLDGITLSYEEDKDFQYTSRYLLIKPKDSKKTIKFNIR